MFKLGIIFSISTLCFAQSWDYTVSRTSVVTDDIYDVGKFDNKRNAIIAARLFVAQQGVKVSYIVFDKANKVLVAFTQQDCTKCQNKYVAAYARRDNLDRMERSEVALNIYLGNRKLCSDCVYANDYFAWLPNYVRN